MRLVLDHLMLAASDHMSSRIAFERLGFFVTPMRPNSPMGGQDGKPGGSQLILFDSLEDDYLNYLEISSLCKPKADLVMVKVLDRPDGGAMMVSRAWDLDEVEAYWSENSISKAARWAVKFPTTGSVKGTEFDILMAEPDLTPVCINAVWSSDIEGYLAPEWRKHPNTAKRWSKVVVLSPENQIQEHIEFFERAYNQKASITSEGALYDVGQVEFEIISPYGFAAAYPGVTPPNNSDGACIALIVIEVMNIAAVERLFIRNGIVVRSSLSGGLVSDDNGVGCVFEFIPTPRI